MSIAGLAAAVEMPTAEVKVAVATLIETGSITTRQPGWFELADTPGEVVIDGSGEPDESFDAQEVRRRFGEYLLDGVRAAVRLRATPSSQPAADAVASGRSAMRLADEAQAAAWLADHRSSLVAAVRLGCLHGMAELAAQLAAAVWEAGLEAEDRPWWDELARWGEEAAIRCKNPPVLATLLDQSARFLRRAGDVRGAEGQWIRALHIGRRSNDQAIAVRALESLTELYEVGGRLHRKLDAEFELLRWHQRAGDDLEVARARVRIGSTMLAAGRPHSAVDYLVEAEAELAELGESVERERSDALIELGRAQWHMGAVAAARRCFSQALAIVVECDPAAAESVRRLLRTSDDQPLPDHRDGSGPGAVRSSIDK